MRIALGPTSLTSVFHNHSAKMLFCGLTICEFHKLSSIVKSLSVRELVGLDVQRSSTASRVKTGQP